MKMIEVNGRHLVAAFTLGTSASRLITEREAVSARASVGAPRGDVR